ncbi:MAG: hypothetical protein AVDCRST_MAG78-532, partial [uncultured Rubrobacteraceae bacterium]
EFLSGPAFVQNPGRRAQGRGGRGSLLEPGSLGLRNIV